RQPGRGSRRTGSKRRRCRGGGRACRGDRRGAGGRAATSGRIQARADAGEGSGSGGNLRRRHRLEGNLNMIKEVSRTAVDRYLKVVRFPVDAVLNSSGSERSEALGLKVDRVDAVARRAAASALRDGVLEEDAQR